MKIGIDMSITRYCQAGTAIYTVNLIEALKRINSKHEYRFFSINHWRDMSARKTIRSRLNTIYRDILWTHMIMPLQVKHAKVDLLHMPANVIPIFSACPTVVTIHDLIVIHNPQFFPVWHRNFAKLFLSQTVNKAVKIITDSEQSKQDIVELLHISPGKVAVIYPAASSHFHPVSIQKMNNIKQKYGLGSYILTVGTLEPRKNLVRLIKAFSFLCKRGLPYQLVHIGSQGWMYEDIFAEVKQHDLQNSVRFLGRVPEDDLVDLYNAASLFIYPSLYEGFGLPVVEAMACGCPVVTSNVSSLPEVVGTAGVLVDPFDVQQLAGAMERVLEDLILSQTMRQLGFEQAKIFSWERCARETLSIYNQALGL